MFSREQSFEIGHGVLVDRLSLEHVAHAASASKASKGHRRSD
jgi:hypothetical protein